MKLLVVALSLCLIIENIFAASLENINKNKGPTDGQNKTKRTVGNQLHTLTENRPPLLLYNDNSGSGAAGINGFYAPVTLKPVFDPDIPKQVAHQQVVYEFQQTPTNAVSNVHVNQFYQPIHPHNNNKQDSATGQNYYSNNNNNNNNGDIPGSNMHSSSNSNPLITGSESVALPVQHSSLVRHGQNLAQVQFQPLSAPQHIQTQQYVPGKYLYVNGKIIYQPNPHQQQLQQIVPRPLAYLNYNNNNNNNNNPNGQLSQRLTPPPLLHYRRFHPPQAHQMQKITKPMHTAEVVEEQNEGAAEEETPSSSPAQNNEDVEEEEEDGDDREAGYEDEEDDGEGKYFGKYSFEDDEDEGGRYREDDADEEEEDEDNDRGGSRHIPKKHLKKKSNKYNNNDNYKYSEKYSTSSKYENKPKKKKANKKSPKKMHYKAVKYTRELNGSKPRIERIQGKQSENVPVVHKQKIFKEKWYVTKSTDDSNSS